MRSEAEVRRWIDHYKNLAEKAPLDSHDRVVYEESSALLTWVLGDTVPGYSVGDPDPTFDAVYGGGELCLSRNKGYVCTWGVGHAGPHVSSDGEIVVAVWDQEA